jgi:DNA-binding transcriptional regulator YhcF (GntR family)
MNMEEMVRKKIRRGGGNLTPVKLASSLGTDIRTVKKTLGEMEENGEVTLTSWEELLHRDK